MLQIAHIRENKESVKERLILKNFKEPELIDEVIRLDELRRRTQSQLDNVQAQANNMARSIGELVKAGEREEMEKAKNTSALLKEDARQLAEELTEYEQKLQDALVQLPNLPHASVPAGRTPEDNQVMLTQGKKPELDASALPHWDLAAKYDIIDFELGTKITGAGFPVYKGKGARLQRALINFFLDEAGKAGYREVQPPILVNEQSGFGTGQLPDKEGQMYHVGADNLYLVPTAEVPLTNFYRDVIVPENELPVKTTAYTPCFRREAGSYGAHVRGLNRLHQFDKVEIVQITHPDQSYKTLETMSVYVQSLLEKLELPYRVLKLCGGDLGFASALTYDMEVFSAAQDRWLEVSSVSNFETFQTNRLKLRFRPLDGGKPQLAHTLNGSALALPRIVAALLENNQTPEGIRIPPALTLYTGFDLLT